MGAQGIARPTVWAAEEAYWRATNTGWAKAIRYQDYLESKHWHTVRQAALRRAGHKCQECGETRQLNVHHSIYDRLGAEEDRDVIVLCSTCHNRFHGKDDANKADSPIHTSV